MSTSNDLINHLAIWPCLLLVALILAGLFSTIRFKRK